MFGNARKTLDGSLTTVSALAEDKWGKHRPTVGRSSRIIVFSYWLLAQRSSSRSNFRLPYAPGSFRQKKVVESLGLALLELARVRKGGSVTKNPLRD
jgi:hypothetical protein